MVLRSMIVRAVNSIIMMDVNVFLRMLLLIVIVTSLIAIICFFLVTSKHVIRWMGHVLLYGYARSVVYMFLDYMFAKPRIIAHDTTQ